MAMHAPTPITDKAAATLPSDRTPEDVASLLKRPFHPSVIKSKPVGNGFARYVDIHNVLDRLNRAAPVWSWRITDIQILTMPITRKGQLVDMPVVHVTGELQIPGLGSRQGIGTAPCEGTEDAAKIAESDATKRAASAFGVPCGR